MSVSCGGATVDPAATSGGGTDAGPLPDDVFELDYRGLRDTLTPGGLGAGYHYHHAFSIDLARRSRSYTEIPSSEPVDLVTMYDFASCEARSGDEFSYSAATLSPGPSPAWIDYVELRFATKSTDLGGQGACYGVRRADGRWTWNFDIVPLVPDGPGRVRVRLPIDGADVDGFKVVFSLDTKHMACESVRYRALPKRP